MFLAALRTTRGLALLFALAAVTFLVLGLGALGHRAGLTQVGGLVEIVTAFTAWYLAAGGVLASTFGRPILPNPPLFRS